MLRCDGASLLAPGPEGIETHVFASPAEAEGRTAFVNEALSWTGTPFRDCADVKGPKGAVDCAMLMVRAAVDTGRIAAFDPRPYSPRWHLHQTEEKFVDILEALGAREVDAPRVGDVVVWRFGKTFSHGGILINSVEVVHAYYAAGMVLTSRLDEPLLQFLPLSGCKVPRGVRYFSLWYDPS